jgi:hypothetical protein
MWLHFPQNERSVRWMELLSGEESALLCENGPEYISQEVFDWSANKKITLLFIQLGKTTQNNYPERLNGQQDANGLC